MFFTPSLPITLMAAAAIHSVTAIPAISRTSESKFELARRQFASPPFPNINIDVSCNERREFVEGAIRDAAELLAAWPTTDVAKNLAYLKFMDIDGDATRAQTITKRMKKLSDITSTTTTISRKLTLKCDFNDTTTQNCKNGSQAHVPSESDRGDVFESGANGGTVVLCSRFLPKISLAQAVENCTQAESNEIGLFRNRGESLLHELTHLNIMMNAVGTDDCVYSSVNCHLLAQEAPWVAMINADNYAWMALDNYLEQKQTCGKELIAHNFPLKTDDKFDHPAYPRCRKNGTGLRFGQFKTEHNTPTIEQIEERKARLESTPDIDQGKDETSDVATEEIIDTIKNEDIVEGVDEDAKDLPSDGGTGGAHEGEDVIDAEPSPEDGLEDGFEGGFEEVDDGDAADLENIIAKGPEVVPSVVTITGFNGIPIATSTIWPTGPTPPSSGSAGAQDGDL